MNFFLKSTLVLVLNLGIGTPLYIQAQEPVSGCIPSTTRSVLGSISTDRPDQTESSSLVPKGMIQIETGFLRENKRNESIVEHSYLYTTTLLKYAISNHFEFRLLTEFAGEETLDTGTEERHLLKGFNPLTIGAKIFICEENGILPKIALISHLSLPYVGHKEFRPTFWAPGFRFTMQHAFSEKTALSYNIGAEWDGENPNTSGIYTLSLSHGIFKKVSVFLEAYGFLTEKKRPDHRADGGIMYLLKENLQIDLSSGVGITSNAPSSFVSCGVSWRLPR